ncbi:MAG: hypothetical protein COA45_07840 [Zetaproteobacteria bacterium]|nr:MAG: hypothetical protein COA45_07840 [Zetaproteobacteria bacterium]
MEPLKQEQVNYKLTWEDKGFLVAYYGMITGSDVDKLNRTLHGDIRFDNHKYQIWEFLKSDYSQMSIDDARTLAATDAIASRSTPNVKVAIIANDEHMSLIVKEYTKCMKEIFNSSWEIRLFDKMSSAREWIKE